jgi:two-component system sensor histidine kinase YesM
MIITKKIFQKLWRNKNSVAGNIIILFMTMFILLLTPTIIQTYTAFNQSQTYREIIDNINYANQLNTDVSEGIEPIVWGIVAGKTKFDDSEIMDMITGIRDRMNFIKNTTHISENRGTMEIAIRALNILENYLMQLREQINRGDRVERNEEVLDEIRICVANVSDQLREFSSKQVAEVSVLNTKMYNQSYQSFVINILFSVFIVLASGFASMYIVRKSLDEQKEMQKLRYKVLQEQITPHFLFNTLDAIIWAAEAKHNADVIKIVTALSSFFRTSLSSGHDFVLISKDIEHVRSYLVIQQMRYNDVLSFEIDIDEGLGDQEILKLLLQPLVENSLYHGIKNTRERGKIFVSVQKYSGKVRFSVTDNGIGITKERLDELMYDINHSDKSRKGYGLFNVNRRLMLYYDMPRGIEIQSEYGKGTEVSFVLDIL